LANIWKTYILVVNSVFKKYQCELERLSCSIANSFYDFTDQLYGTGYYVLSKSSNKDLVDEKFEDWQAKLTNVTATRFGCNKYEDGGNSKVYVCVFRLV
ncbi:hypothetical protein OESDEN_16298, partial [Oesophagostomum dentatum]